MLLLPLVITGLVFNSISTVATPVFREHGVLQERSVNRTELSPIPEDKYSGGGGISKKVIIALVVVCALVSIFVVALVLAFRGALPCARPTDGTTEAPPMRRKRATASSNEYPMNDISCTTPQRQFTNGPKILSPTSTLTNYTDACTDPPPPAYTRRERS